MTSFRAFLFRRSRLAMMLVAVAIALKALLPDGFMPDIGGTTISIRICADVTGRAMTREIVIAHKGTTSGKSAKGEGVCAFSALAHGALGGVDALLLACALLFLIVLGFAPLLPAAPRRVAFLRPHLRGPPALG